MATFNYAQLVALAQHAGFSNGTEYIAAAIALAESGGDPNAYNPEQQAGTPTGHGSRGLWQIYGYAHPEYDNSGLYDPQANANAAYQVWKNAGNSFRPWSTYVSGAYKPFLSFSSSPSVNQDPTATNSSTAASKLIQDVSGIVPGFNLWNALKGMPSLPIRIVKIFTGFTLMMIGAIAAFLASPTAADVTALGATALGQPEIAGAARGYAGALRQRRAARVAEEGLRNQQRAARGDRRAATRARMQPPTPPTTAHPLTEAASGAMAAHRAQERTQGPQPPTPPTINPQVHAAYQEMNTDVPSPQKRAAETRRRRKQENQEDLAEWERTHMNPGPPPPRTASGQERRKTNFRAEGPRWEDMLGDLGTGTGKRDDE